MDKIYSQENFLEIEKWISLAINNKYSIGIVGLPGFGASFGLKALVKKNSRIKYLGENETELGDFNIIDWEMNDENNEKINNLFKKADIDQKFGVVIQKPHLLNEESFKKNFFYSRIYKFFYLKPYSTKDCELMCKDLGIKLSKKDFVEIYQKSLGVGKLFKYLAVNWPEIETEKWEELKKETFIEVEKCDEETVKKLGLEGLEIGGTKSKKFKIEIGFDLSIKEKGEISKLRLNKEEKNILTYMMENSGQITREKVADFRWGEGKYDEFSDQAINQAMRRLGKKMSKYKIKTIPKVGYVLEEK